MNPENALPGDVLLGEDDSEYRALRPAENGEILAYDMHAGARVLRVALDELEGAVPREQWGDAPAVEHEPDPPQGVAQYILDGLERQGADSLRAIAEYALELSRYLETAPIGEDLEDELTNEGEQLVDVREADEGKGTIVEKKIPCGKDSCTKCPHGPYKYRAYREGSKVKTEYLGKA